MKRGAFGFERGQSIFEGGGGGIGQRHGMSLWRERWFVMGYMLEEKAIKLVQTMCLTKKKSIIVQATGAFDGPGLVATGFSNSARHNVTNVQGHAGFQSCVPFGKH